jgi:4-alpha-glucanotransferase
MPNNDSASQHRHHQRQHPVFSSRRAGVLLHPTSLPGGEELGELGPDAFRFVDFLAAAGFSVWQVLPLGPTHTDLSPYMSPSAHAGNPRLISLQMLQQQGLLAAQDISVKGDQHRRRALLTEARLQFLNNASAEDQQDYESFRHQHRRWLEDFCLFQALRQMHHGEIWTKWEPCYRDRKPSALQQ